MAELIAEISSLDVPVILDAKRGDIDSSAQAYAEAYLAQGELACDALTINPYLGVDSLEPFFQAAHRNQRGVFVLVKTSNPGSRDFQDCEVAPGRYLYQRVADALASAASRSIDSRGFSPIGAVVGATHPGPLATLRTTLPQSYLLIPGYGAQGGSSEALAAAFLPKGLGAVVNSSRRLTYLTREDDFAEAAELATRHMRDDINRAYRQQ
jgi:orotidine-5'-phosphate decarboxylase